MRCSMCGHENPVGSLFCLNCGTQVSPAAPSTPPPAAGLPVRCGTCGGENPGGMRFCRQCGGGLAAPAPVAAYAPTPAPPPAYIAPPSGPIPGSAMSCPRCSASTPGGMPFCQQCGFQLPPDPQAATMAVGQGAPYAAPISAPSPAPVAAAQAFAPSPMPQPAAAVGAWGAAIAVNRDGSDGERFSLSAEFVHIGRAGTEVCFAEDRFLAPKHARIERKAGGVEVVPLETFNGVYRKLNTAVELSHGSMILVGREVLRFEFVDADERVEHPLVRHGVALFGSPPREPWARLMQLLPSGGMRDVRHLYNPTVVLGREDGDLVYRDDQFMSRRHAEITWDGRVAKLADVGSSNGTFLRLVGREPLRTGDQLRVGDQLIRFELA